MNELVRVSRRKKDRAKFLRGLAIFMVVIGAFIIGALGGRQLSILEGQKKPTKLAIVTVANLWDKVKYAFPEAYDEEASLTFLQDKGGALLPDSVSFFIPSSRFSEDFVDYNITQGDVASLTKVPQNSSLTRAMITKRVEDLTRSLKINDMTHCQSYEILSERKVPRTEWLDQWVRKVEISFHFGC